PGAREGREGGRALHRLADEAQVREGPLVQRGRRAIRGRRRRRGHTACWRLSPYSVKSFMNQSQTPPTAAPRLRRRNFGRAKVGCYDETAVVKGVSVEPSVRLIPLGGLGEIGLNMMLIESGDDVVAVDCGLMFPDDELPGVDYVIPDFSYALAKREGFRGVVLTHGHEDHIGALPYLLKSARVPVYATPLTRALVAEKLREHPLPEPADLRLMRPREPFMLGPFTIEPIRVTHSIADGMGLAITTPVGTIVHTGDFKLDPSPLDGEPADTRRFAEVGEQGVAVLCSDSTNVDRPGHTRSEIEVGAALAERFDGATGRIILATFASHIHRIQQVLTLAAARGRQVALLGRSMEKNVAIASDLGYLGVPSGLLRPLEEVVALPAERQVILSTGSQGEYRHLLGHARLAAGMGFGPDRVMLVEDGTAIEVTPTTARVIPGYPTGRVLVDGTGIGDIGAVVLRDRQILADDGVIAVALTFDRSGTVVAGPEIASRGVVYVKENEALLEDMKAAVRAALAARDPSDPWDRDAVAARVRTAVRQLVNQRVQRKPVVLPII